MAIPFISFYEFDLRPSFHFKTKAISQNLWQILERLAPNAQLPRICKRRDQLE
jgi:hypothetical protein